jgi:hypothetical protein
MNKPKLQKELIWDGGVLTQRNGSGTVVGKVGDGLPFLPSDAKNTSSLARISL